MSNRTIQEVLTTPVQDAGDVLVAGAGSAGIAAAVIAARSGYKVTLIDTAGFVGGTLATGVPILGQYDGEKLVVRGFYQELVERLQQRNGCEIVEDFQTIVNVDVEKLKVILLELLVEAGVKPMLHTILAGTSVSGNRIDHVLVEGKGGRRALKAKFFIDCTGDADLSAAAGVPIEKGRKLDGKVQPMTLFFAMGNIDIKRFEEWGGFSRLGKKWNEVAQHVNFRNPRRGTFSGMWGVASRTGERAFNVTRVLDADGSEGESLTKSEIEGRLQAWEFSEKFLRPHVPGFEEAYISWTAYKIGVRETRRVVGEYVITGDDIWNFVKFPDVINCGSYPIDIHNPTGHGTNYDPDHFYGGKYWTIPYRSLVPLKIDNLLVAGRCVSATHEALSAIRVMANTIGMGEAAGHAAALSLRNGLAPRKLDPALVQDAILSNGGWLGTQFETSATAAPVPGIPAIGEADVKTSAVTLGNHA